MKTLFGLIVIVGMLSGCIVRTHPHGHRNEPRRASCPPSQHWNGNQCVHNGNGRGRDHRR